MLVQNRSSLQENENCTVYTMVIELQFKCKHDPPLRILRVG